MYKPQWEHLERHPGSYAGGVSSIDFSAPPTQESTSRPPTRGRGEFAAKNEASSLFKSNDSAAPTRAGVQREEQSMQQRRAVPPGGHSSLNLAHAEAAPAGQKRRETAQPSPPSRSYRNPVLGVDCQSSDMTTSSPGQKGSAPAAGSSRQDCNRSSVVGGIFGQPDASPPGKGEAPMAKAPSNRRDPNEMSGMTRVGSKRMVGGFVEYCA
mmetsp:Transcript_10110/g.22745  ORF Transcript_10110/g.22745 Transcript_10110/m.22745 type:complete len:210 (-) Transcript_10110:39-668(-)